MSKFTKEFIASELVLAEKATPGPWKVEHEFNVYADLYDRRRGVASCGGYYNSAKTDETRSENIANSELIVSARENYPAALAEIEALREKLKAAEKVCKVIKEFRDNGEFFDPDTCRALDAWEKIK